MTEIERCLINRLEHMFEKKKPVSKEEKELLETYKNKNGEFDFTKIKDKNKLFKMIDIFERFADEEAEKEFDKCHFPFDKKKFENEFKDLFYNVFKVLEDDYSDLKEDDKDSEENEYAIEIDDNSEEVPTPKNAKNLFKDVDKEEPSDTRKEIINTINRLNNEESKENKSAELGQCNGINPTSYRLCENVHFYTSYYREDPFFRKAVIKILSEIYFPNKKVIFERYGFGDPMDPTYENALKNDIFVVLTNKWGKIRKDIINALKNILPNSPIYIIDAQTLNLKRILDNSEFESYRMTLEQEDLENF